MYIYDVSTPSEPKFRSFFSHGIACDPVFVQGDIAYVTLRDGTECDNFINQLDVVSVADWDNPQLLASYAMTHPIGLTVIEDQLYLCDDYAGLRVFDASEPVLVGERQIAHLDDFTAVDAIGLSEDLLIITGPDGIYQFNPIRGGTPEFLSQIND